MKIQVVVVVVVVVVVESSLTETACLTEKPDRRYSHREKK